MCLNNYPNIGQTICSITLMVILFTSYSWAQNSAPFSENELLAFTETTTDKSNFTTTEPTTEPDSKAPFGVDDASCLETPERYLNALQGIDINDLISLEKHLTGKEKLTNPYQILAADVNRSNGLTNKDMEELQQRILQSKTFSPMEMDWRFLPDDFDFAEGENPLGQSFPEITELALLNDLEWQNLVEVKMGDIDNSLFKKDENVSNKTLTFEMPDAKVRPNQVNRITFRAKDFKQIAGFQFALKFDKNHLKFKKVKTILDGMDESNFGLELLDEGIITVAWHHMDNIVMEDYDVVFAIEFQGKKRAPLSSVLKLCPKYIPSVAYSHQGDKMDFALAYEQEESVKLVSYDFEFYENKEKVFDEKKVISLHLPNETEGVFTLFTKDGKILRTESMDLSKGYNEIELYNNECQAEKVIFYEFRSDDFTAKRRLVLI